MHVLTGTPGSSQTEPPCRDRVYSQPAVKLPSDCLLAAMKEKLKPWDTTTTLTDGNGLSRVQDGRLGRSHRSSPSLMKVLVSRIPGEGILGMAFFAGQKCTLCFDKCVLT